MSDHAELRSVLTTKYPAERAVVKKSDLAALLADFDRVKADYEAAMQVLVDNDLSFDSTFVKPMKLEVQLSETKQQLDRVKAERDRLIDTHLIDHQGDDCWFITLPGYESTYPTREDAIAALLKGSE